MTEARSGDIPVSVEQMMALISTAINTRALYSPGHPRVLQSSRRVVEMLKLLGDRQQRETVTFLVIGDELLIDQKPMRTGSPLQMNFIQMFRRRRIQRLTIAQGLDEAELMPFIEAIVLGRFPRTGPHLIVGQAELGAGGGIAEEVPADEAAGEGSEGTGGQEGRAPAEVKRALESLGGRVDDVREAFSRLRTGEAQGFDRVDGLVWGFIEALTRSTSGTLPLATLREHDEATFVHSVNVCILTLLQARWYGFQGPMLHAIGMAGLLHDIGKLFIPLPIPTRPGRLPEEDWRIVRSHPEVGAWYLSGLASSAPISVLVAFEHHLRYDGLPSYPSIKSPRRPNLASQMTAIADAYDAMTSLQPERRPLARPAATEILRRRAGNFYDPLIVANFVQLLSALNRPA